MAGVDAAAWMESFKEYLEPVAKMALDVKDKVGEKQSGFVACTLIWPVLRTIRFTPISGGGLLLFSFSLFSFLIF